MSNNAVCAYVGDEPPTATSDGLMVTLAGGAKFDYNAPVWLRLTDFATVEKLTVIAIGDVVEQMTVDSTLSSNAFTFSELTNCIYDGEKLVYTNGNVAGLDGAGYTAYLPFTKIRLTLNDATYIAIGSKEHLADYTSPDIGTVLFFSLDSGFVFPEISANIVTLGSGHEFEIEMFEGKIRVLDVNRDQYSIYDLPSGVTPQYLSLWVKGEQPTTLALA